MPAASAACSISPDSRVSRMMSTCGRAASTRRVAAAPRASASSAVRNSPATPRTPSVPNSLRAIFLLVTGSALGELRTLARLLQTGLLALLRARVARQEASALELASQVGIRLQQRARDAVAQRSGLRGDAAAVKARDHVHPLLVADCLERLAGGPLQGEGGEVLLER